MRLVAEKRIHRLNKTFYLFEDVYRWNCHNKSGRAKATLGAMGAESSGLILKLLRTIQTHIKQDSL